jgi:hypothetical protein
MSCKFSNNYPLHPSILAFIDNSNSKIRILNENALKHHKNVLIKCNKLQSKSPKAIKKTQANQKNPDLAKKVVKLLNSTHLIERERNETDLNTYKEPKTRASLKVKERNFLLENKLQIQKMNSKNLTKYSQSLRSNETKKCESRSNSKTLNLFKNTRTRTLNSNQKSGGEIDLNHVKNPFRKSNQQLNESLKRFKNSNIKLDQRKIGSKNLSLFKNRNTLRQAAKRDLVDTNFNKESQQIRENNIKIKNSYEFDFEHGWTKEQAKYFNEKRKLKDPNTINKNFGSQFFEQVNDKSNFSVEISPISTPENSHTDEIKNYLLQEVFEKILFTENQSFHKTGTDQIDSTIFINSIENSLTPIKGNFTEAKSNKARYKRIESKLRDKKSFCPVKKFDNCLNKNANSTKKDFVKLNIKSKNQEYDEGKEIPSNKHILELENDAKLAASQEFLKSDVNLTDNEK